MIMANLSLMSAEVVLEISQYLDYGAKVNLSSTCRRLRQRLLSDVFGELHLSHRTIHCSRVLTLARKYGCYTKTLYFRARVDIYDDFHGTAPYIRPALPREAWPLIAGASQVRPRLKGSAPVPDSGPPLLPKLRSLTIDIQPDDLPRQRHGVNGMLYTDPWTPVPTAEALRKLERRGGWRRLLTEVWAAASVNPTLKDLTVVGYQPVRLSAMTVPEYGAFLGRLESLNIVITAEVARARGYDINRAPSFQALVCSALDEAFFQHTRSLRRLRIESKEWVFLTVASDRHPQLAKLDLATRLPLLEHVELRGFLISQGLTDCLHACRRKLRSIRLTNCIAEGQYYDFGHTPTVYGDDDGATEVSAEDDYDDNDPTEMTAADYANIAAAVSDNGDFAAAFINWARCLDQLADTERLCRLDVDFDYPDRRHGGAPFSRADIWGGEDSPYDLDPRSPVMRARALRRAEPTRQVFEYFLAFGSFDSINRDPNVNSKAFLLGKDQEAYDALKVVTARNQARRDADPTRRIVDI
ncbi:hypothetical protein MAPG_03418 [Magnaporthiopsis poae ATCC 64411]|uniref:F-box domain-containing protein n=1 Tax=Magnaporthiopsis poae (strain ATCC 64411 / 73-15) TaxID=644358 RepID=A0A0C4DTY8_MAGP6|nr:hypothetical protein MAPG_03418 [Magnaporthiopsis poae ATCC 64411]